MNEKRVGVGVEPRRVCLGAALPIIFCLAYFSAEAFAQSGLVIDKLEGNGIQQAVKEVGFSALLEGTVADANLAVFVFAYQPGLNAWRTFPATTDSRPGSDGKYRWRAICQFGEVDGPGVGDTYQVRAVAFDRSTIAARLPARLPLSAPKTSIIALKRVK